MRRVGALADQAEIGAAAKRQAKRVKQDGFAGPCLACQYGEAALEGQRQPLDQNDIGYGQAVQHHSTSNSEATESTVRWKMPFGSDRSGSSARASNSVVQKESG